MDHRLHTSNGGGASALIRLAAVGDVHVGLDSAPQLREELRPLESEADLLIIAGDLTQHGQREEAQVLAAVLRDLKLPKIVVLGNHDYHHGEEVAIRRDLEDAGVIVLEGESTVLQIAGKRVGVAGTKGFGGGFAGACGSEFGEPEMKAFIRHTKDIAHKLEACLLALDTDFKVVVTHYAPIKETLAGERLEIYPFLGSYMLGEAIDRGHPDLALHGHAHRGAERGVTAGGVPVRNVARHVLRDAYKVYCLTPRGETLRGESVAMCR